MMGSYDTQQVCLNGHQITDKYYRAPEFRKDFCNRCGEKTTHICPNCNAEIRGDYQVKGVVAIGFPTAVPKHCHNCGSPYPWTIRKKESEALAIEATPADSVLQIEKVCSRFHIVARQLRFRHDRRPTLEINDEYDVQDLLLALLQVHFDDIRPEEVTPSYAGKSSRMDFLLKRESIVVEVKKTRLGLGDKEVGGQLIEDIARYQAHVDCKILICFVYDPDGFIRNPRGLEHDLNRAQNGLSVKVIITP